MNDEPRNSTLRDYLAAIRRRRRAILVIALSGVLVALAISLIQSRTYTADASFRVKDLNESLTIAGLLPRQGDLPSATAAQGAETATTAEVIELVRTNLGLSDSAESLQSRISAVQQPQSNLITVSADAPTPEGAADLANAVTNGAVEVANRRTREQYAKFASEIRAKALADPTQRDVLLDRAARLEAVSTVADLADIAEEATPPTSPSAPKPVQNAIIGGIAGLLIGLIAAGVLEALDRRLRRPDELQDMLGIPLVGIVPDNAMGGVPTAGIPAEEHVASMDAFRMLQTNLAFLDKETAPKVVLVTSPLPEEGKTTVATGLALASAAGGQRTLLVEADFHRPVHAERLGIEESPGMADYLTGHAKPQDVLQALEFIDPAVAQSNGDPTPAHSVLACITAGDSDLWSAEMLSFGRFSAFIEQVKKVYDLVVIDSGPVLAVAETLQIVPRVDAVLFCVRIGKTTREQAKAGKESLERLPERLTGLVATGVTASDSDGYSYYSYAYNYRFGTGEEQAPWRVRKAGASSRD